MAIELLKKNKETIECVASWMRQPLKLVEYFCQFDASVQPAFNTATTVDVIETIFKTEVATEQAVLPEIHLYDVASLITEDRNEINELLPLVTMLATIPDLTLCVIRLFCGNCIVLVDGIFCSQTQSLEMLARLEQHLTASHCSYHVEYHGLPKANVIASLHCND